MKKRVVVTSVLEVDESRVEQAVEELLQDAHVGTTHHKVVVANSKSWPVPTLVPCHRARPDRACDASCRSCKGTGKMRSLDSYACNACGGPMLLNCNDLGMPPREPEYPELGGLVEQSCVGGYESTHLLDLQEYVFSICEPCLRTMFDRMVIAPRSRSVNINHVARTAGEAPKPRVSEEGSDDEGAGGAQAPEPATVNEYEADREHMAQTRFTWDHGPHGKRAVGARGQCNLDMHCKNAGAWRVYHNDHLSIDVACDEHHKDQLANSMGHHTAVPMTTFDHAGDRLRAWMKHVVLHEGGVETRSIGHRHADDGESWKHRDVDRRICVWYLLPESIAAWAASVGAELPPDTFEGIADKAVRQYSALWMPKKEELLVTFGLAYEHSIEVEGGELFLAVRKHVELAIGRMIARGDGGHVRDMMVERWGEGWKKEFGLEPYTPEEQAARDAHKERLFASMLAVEESPMSYSRLVSVAHIAISNALNARDFMGAQLARTYATSDGGVATEAEYKRIEDDFFARVKKWKIEEPEGLRAFYEALCELCPDRIGADELSVLAHCDFKDAMEVLKAAHKETP